MEGLKDTPGNRDHFMPDPVTFHNRNLRHFALQRATSSLTDRAITARVRTPVDDGTGLPIPRTDTFPFGPAAPGNERLLIHLFKGTDILKREILSITLSVELRAGEAPRHMLTAVHRIGIERPAESCCTAGIDLRPKFPYVPYMVTELYGKVSKEPGGF